jgi:hypothetical protein
MAGTVLRMIKPSREVLIHEIDEMMKLFPRNRIRNEERLRQLSQAELMRLHEALVQSLASGTTVTVHDPNWVDLGRSYA